MRLLLGFTLLTGCGSIYDNTTVGDKAIIGSALTVMAYSWVKLGE